MPEAVCEPTVAPAGRAGRPESGAGDGAPSSSGGGVALLEGAEDMIESDILVEEISIDGMCGVY